MCTTMKKEEESKRFQTGDRASIFNSGEHSFEEVPQGTHVQTAEKCPPISGRSQEKSARADL